MPTQTNEFSAFDNLVGKVLSVPKEELKRREELYQKQSKQNPNRRGPKPKRRNVKTS